jgi:hypothetical protein
MRRLGAGEPFTVVSGVELSRANNESVTAQVVMNPQTGAVEVQLVKQR